MGYRYTSIANMMLMLPAYILFHKKTFIITLHNEMWENLSSLQSQKKMLKHIFFWRCSKYRDMHVYSLGSRFSFFNYPLFNLENNDIYLHINLYQNETPTK